MTQIRNFADVYKLLEVYIPRGQQAGSYSLDRMQELMTVLGNPQDSYKVVHVAGTSGKTSTCYYIAGLLKAAGQKVGLTVSPHVDHVSERVQINLEPLPEARFCEQLSEFIEIIEKTDIKPTYFELLVAFAFWEFANQKVDYAVVEVGLGGLLDGTNVIHRPDKISVITDIGLDHTNVLGNSLNEISAQKAGIIQDHNQVFVYRQSDEVMQPIKARSAVMHAVLHEVEPEEDKTFKQRNYYLAKNVFDFIDQNEGWMQLSQSKLLRAMNLVVPARMEEFKRDGKTIIIDGSHNGQKIAALVESIQKTYPYRSPVVLLSFVKTKEDVAPEALQQLKRLTSKVIITTFEGEQDTPKVSMDPQLIADLSRQAGFQDITVIPDPKAAFQQLTSQPEDFLIVTGSFYLLNHIRPLLKTV